MIAMVRWLGRYFRWIFGHNSALGSHFDKIQTGYRHKDALIRYKGLKRPLQGNIKEVEDFVFAFFFRNF